MKFPLVVRALLIAVVTILILGAIALIDGKINERRNRADSVERQFAAETSNAQLVSGPFLMLTCELKSKEFQGDCPARIFVPASLKMQADVPVDVLHRGIFPIHLFRARLQFSGSFEWPAAPPQNSNYAVSTWKHAYLVMAVSDPRGIKGLSIAGNAPIDARFAIRHDLGPYTAKKPGEGVPFDFTMQLVGTTNLMFTPVAERNELRMLSAWPHPSFQGAWAPDERQVGPDGFTAVWRISSQATGGEPAWRARIDNGSLFKDTGNSAGLAIFNPLNIYTLSYRATEYAFLFLLFTFSALALTEVLAGVRLHAIQYLLVGSALAVFFLLLVALSEHIRFAYAYLAAASACVLLLTAYLRHPLGTWLRTTSFFTMFVVLYGVLFVLLRSEDHALLMGSLLVFGVLAVTMLATRKLDWEEVSKRMRGTPPAGAVA